MPDPQVGRGLSAKDRLDARTENAAWMSRTRLGAERDFARPAPAGFSAAFLWAGRQLFPSAADERKMLRLGRSIRNSPVAEPEPDSSDVDDPVTGPQFVSQTADMC